MQTIVLLMMQADPGNGGARLARSFMYYQSILDRINAAVQPLIGLTVVGECLRGGRPQCMIFI